MTEPDDRELEQYLKGGGKLSQRYREASGEVAPPELDEAILAQARAAASRPRRAPRPWFSGLALAASLVLAVNLGWNVYRSREGTLQLRELDGVEKQKADDVAAKKEAAAPLPATVPAAQPPASPARGPAASGGVAPLPEPAPPPMAFHDAPRASASAPSSPAAVPAESPGYGSSMASGSGLANADAGGSTADKDQAMAEPKSDAADRKLALDLAEQRQMQEREAEQRRDEQARAQAQGAAAAYERAPPYAAPEAAQPRAKAAPMSESQKIDRLIAYIGGLQGAKFVRNGSEHGPQEAMEHLRLKREKAGDRVKTADDFIRLCASYSSASGEAYLIKFADGRTRTAEDVLREELGRINAGG